MIVSVVILSLIITGIHVVLLDGMLLSFVRVAGANCFDKWFGQKLSKYIQKPLWSCLPCMAGIWTVLLTRKIDIGLILAVCGVNMIISRAIEQDETVELIQGTAQETEYHDDIPTISRHVKKIQDL